MVNNLFSSIKFNCSNLCFAHYNSSNSASFNILNDGTAASKGVALIEVIIVGDHHLLNALLTFLLAASTTPFIFGL
jgi:hypothetical protein